MERIEEKIITYKGNCPNCKAGGSIINVGSDINKDLIKNSKVIYKYPLEIIDSQFLELPFNAKILTVQIQESKPQLWALVDPDYETEKRNIRIYGTGHHINQHLKLKYISTIQINSLVFHIFENEDYLEITK